MASAFWSLKMFSKRHNKHKANIHPVGLVSEDTWVESFLLEENLRRDSHILIKAYSPFPNSPIHLPLSLFILVPPIVLPTACVLARSREYTLVCITSPFVPNPSTAQRHLLRLGKGEGTSESEGHSRRT